MIKLHFSANATYTLYSQTQRNQSKWHSMLQIKSGSTLLSCATSLKLDLIKLHPRLGVPPPWAKIITSQADWTSPSAKRVTQGKVMFDEMQSTVQEPLVKPLTALFRGLLQPCTGALFKREPSVVKNEPGIKTISMMRWVQWYQDQPHMTTPYGPHSSLLQPHTGAPFKGDLSVIERWARYQNDQDSKLSSLVPISALYICPIQALFKPLTALFKIPLQEPHSREDQWSYRNQTSMKMISMPRQVQWYQNQPCMTAPYGPHSSPLWPHSKSPYSPLWPHSEEITSPDSITRYTSVQLNKQEKMHPLRPPEHRQQPNQWHSKQYVQSLHLLENPEAVDMENAQGLWIWFL